jgi:SAM-dependent methyltransferase
MLAFSDACERNKDPILQILTEAFARCNRVLEIGSGTGQHAVHFARHLPHLEWQPTDMAENLPGLADRIRIEGPPNLLAPLALDVRAARWPTGAFDAVFSANTLHIMDWDGARHFFHGVGTALGAGGVLCVYGPFRYGGRYTTESNAAFDRSLKARDPASGLRDFEAVNELALAQDFALTADHAMPANNQTLVWKKGAQK